mmetsp:Transcript_63244/g.150851  ORF Transcript_63244/g.150851 Transcript_63244/m.150851 type:complete len:100 (+) Transcript_63244:136-435(+)
MLSTEVTHNLHLSNCYLKRPQKPSHYEAASHSTSDCERHPHADFGLPLRFFEDEDEELPPLFGVCGSATSQMALFFMVCTGKKPWSKTGFTFLSVGKLN